MDLRFPATQPEHRATPHKLGDERSRRRELLDYRWATQTRATPTRSGAHFCGADPSLQALRHCRIMLLMRTVAETEIFIKYAAGIWTDDERNEFIAWVASNPEAGDLIPGSGGCRKPRWSRPGTGKRGGARVIYFLHQDSTIWLLIAYAKAKFDDLPASFLAKLKREVENAV